MQQEDEKNPAIKSLEMAFKVRKPKEASAEDKPAWGGLVKKKPNDGGGYFSALKARRDKANQGGY